jgi:charged multivesicular body protein 1
MQRVTKDMTQVVHSMESALKSMNLEQISTMLDRFEKSFENLDVQSQVMEETVGGITAQSIPEGDVQNLMQQTADEAGLELNMEIPGAHTSTINMASGEQDELSQRLAQLRQT